MLGFPCMTDKETLQKLFEAALRDTSDFTGRMPRPAFPAASPVHTARVQATHSSHQTAVHPSQGTPSFVSNRFAHY